MELWGSIHEGVVHVRKGRSVGERTMVKKMGVGIVHKATKLYTSFLLGLALCTHSHFYSFLYFQDEIEKRIVRKRMKSANARLVTAVRVHSFLLQERSHKHKQMQQRYTNSHRQA